MPNCSNCGQKVVGKPAICPNCGRPTRINSPGIMGANGLGCLIAFILGIGIVAVILLPVFASARVAAKKAVIVSQTKRIANAMHMYLTDNNDRFPPLDSSAEVEQRIDRYLEIKSEEDIRTFAAKGTWNKALSGVLLESIASPSETWLFYSERKADDVYSTAIAFVDAQTKFANPYVFEKAMSHKIEIDKQLLQSPTK